MGKGENAGNQHFLLSPQCFLSFSKQVLIFQSYSITCIQRPLKGGNESGLLQQVVFKCRFYYIDFRRMAVSEQWSLKAGGLLMQVVSNTGLTVFILSSANAFNLDQPEILSFGKELTRSRHITTLKKEAFENIVGKGEIVGNQHFLLFPKMFSTFVKTLTFESHLFCRLQVLSFWTSLKFCHLVNS